MFVYIFVAIYFTLL